MLTKYIDYENPRYIHNKVVNYFISKVIDGGIRDKPLWEWLREDTREINLNPRKTAKPLKTPDTKAMDRDWAKLNHLFGNPTKPLPKELSKEWDESMSVQKEKMNRFVEESTKSVHGKESEQEMPRILKRGLDYDERN